MDEKTWLWKKKSAEKTLIADYANNSFTRYEDEEKTEVSEIEKTELRREIGMLNAKLYAALSECNAKDNIAKKQVKIAEEAIIGWEKAEAEAVYYKQELDKVLQQKAVSEARLGHLDAALKECMQQLRFVREYKTRVESDFNALMLRLESTEKEKDSLIYKVRVLQKELDIRKEERDFNLRTSYVAQKQHSDSFFVQNGAYVAKMKNEIEIPGHEQDDEKSSYAESRASTFLSDFKNEKQLGNLEMNLMDDFAEMEKLAVVKISDKENLGEKVDPSVILSMQKILDLLEGINTPSGYTVRVFQWKSDELSDILRNFVRFCSDLMNGRVNLENFAREVAFNLEWIMNHCFSLQDVSSMKDEIRNHFDWDESSESSHNSSCDEEGKLGNSHSEMEGIEKESRGRNGNPIEEQKTINEDLEIQTKIIRIDNEVENKDESCERVDETCNDVKMQESLTRKEDSDKRRQNGWEITAASRKLAECQETIINLGKQLKALASPIDASLFDKVVSTPPRDLSRRSSLLDKMLADDDDKNRRQTGDSNSGVSKVAGSESSDKLSVITSEQSKTAVAISRDIVPCKKNGGRGFFKRLFLRRKKGKTSY